MPETADAYPRATGTSFDGLGPKRKPTHADPLIGYGRHFGRTIRAFCHMHTLVVNGLDLFGSLGDSGEEELENYTAVQRDEHRIFTSLLALVPKLEERLMNSKTSDEDVRHIADLKGAASARSDDTKGLKSVMIDWISPRDKPLIPPLARNLKLDRGFNHDATGRLLCPAGLDWSDPEIKEKLRGGMYMVQGDQWPVFLWKDCQYDHENPWHGFLRSKLLISTFKYIFTSPSSVDQAPKATRSGNARIHGMTRVSLASLAYSATQPIPHLQARFALCSAAVFTRNDTETDSVRFYNTLLEFLEDPEEKEDVSRLLTFWNQLVFHASSSTKQPISKESALAALRRKRDERVRMRLPSN